MRTLMMTKRLDTRTDLVLELEKVASTPLIEEIIKEAKAGEFHDFKNQKYDCGKMALYGLLMKAKLSDLANRVSEGEFDEKADEEDKAKLRKTIPQSAWSVFGLDPIPANDPRSH
jgi:hypothetical protein